MIVCPNYLEMWVKKRKKYYLNLNNYRNRHFIVSNNLKILFKKQIQEQIQNIKPIKWQIELQFEYFARSKLVGDLENHCIVIQKFLQDTLVENWIIQEDTCYFISKVIYLYWGIDKDNPRVEAIIIEKN